MTVTISPSALSLEARRRHHFCRRAAARRSPRRSGADHENVDVAQPVDKVWRFFDDIPQVAACLPGAELTEDLGDGSYKGKVAIRMGPVKLQFAGTAKITERDDANKRIVVDAAGADEKGRGQAAMLVTAHLVPAAGGTKVEVTQDLQLQGATRNTAGDDLGRQHCVDRDFAPTCRIASRPSSVATSRPRRRVRLRRGVGIGVRAAHGVERLVPPALPSLPTRGELRGSR
jgi:carbon monoxide dehydrogenase subunit G